jgi:hypothetical protein
MTYPTFWDNILQQCREISDKILHQNSESSVHGDAVLRLVDSLTVDEQALYNSLSLQPAIQQSFLAESTKLAALKVKIAAMDAKTAAMDAKTAAMDAKAAAMEVEALTASRQSATSKLPLILSTITTCRTMTSLTRRHCYFG